MTLVDKLGEVHRGDLLLLGGTNYDRVGYVIDYNPETITLSNTNPRDKKTGEVRAMGFWSQLVKECVVTFSLENFCAYRILEKCAISESQPKS